MSVMMTPTTEIDVVIDGVSERLVPGRSRIAADHPLVKGSPDRWREVGAADGGPTRAVVRTATSPPTPGGEPVYDMPLSEELKIRAEWIAEIATPPAPVTRSRPRDAEQRFWDGVALALEPAVTAEQTRAQKTYDVGLESMTSAHTARLKAEREESDSMWRGRLAG